MSEERRSTKRNREVSACGRARHSPRGVGVDARPDPRARVSIQIVKGMSLIAKRTKIERIFLNFNAGVSKEGTSRHAL